MEARPASRLRQQFQPQSPQTHQNPTALASSPNNSQQGTQFPTINAFPQVNAATNIGKGGGALKSIDQKFQVNSCNGTSSFQFPLQVTPARNGFHPSLNLSYDSGAGNDCFGIGWNLSIEGVSRKTSKKIPIYNDSDCFIISGQDDLVPIGGIEAPETVRDDYSVRGFRPRVDQQSLRIERWTHRKTEGDVYWRTTSTANVTKIYGRTDESRVLQTLTDGRKRIFTWLLCEAYDPLGNSMLFSYKSENAEGLQERHATLPIFEAGRDQEVHHRARYLKSIRYGNKKPCRDLDNWTILPPSTEYDWMFEVVFDYGEHDVASPVSRQIRPWPARKDPVSSCSGGFEIRKHRLCRRMLMFHHLKELVVKDYLVSSVQFEYLESPSGSMLNSITECGHILDKNGTPLSQTVAPRTFTYNPLVIAANQKILKKKPSSIQMVPDPQPAYQWIDLNGEGSPGILVQIGSSWFYQRNKNAGKIDAEDNQEQPDLQKDDDFGPLQLLNVVPNVESSTVDSFQDLDGSGFQSLITSNKNGRIDGYYDCFGQGLWKPHKLFPTSLNLDHSKGTIKRVDLTGNGQDDLLVTKVGQGEFTWFESLGKKGFGSQYRTRMPSSYNEPVPDDHTQAVFMADMNGDGLADLVRVSNNRISYWQNLGYGSFSSEIVMANSPRLNVEGDFELSRVLLVDADGSGTADLVYLVPSGGVMIYTNCCGNQWSDGRYVVSFPKVHNPSSVFALDLLGKGTSCLCWIAPDSFDLAIFYLDLSPGPKPYLLRSISNGYGLESTIYYSPSTQSYLQDEREGRPWRTKLPFPVHTVRKVVDRDETTQTSFTTQYRYHDGYYDGHEREFRGFGMVEKWEIEEFVLNAGLPYRKPALYTKTWFHTGAPVDSLALSDTFKEPRLQTMIPGNLPLENLRDVCRALKGGEIRTEIYGLDGSDRAEIPYLVTETSYEVTTIQALQSCKQPGTYRTDSKETLTIKYERGDDPRIEHGITLERNDFGDVTKSLSIRYRRIGGSEVDAEIEAVQNDTDIVLSETQYTNPISQSESFYKPSVAVQRQYRIFGVPFDAILTSKAVSSEDFSNYLLRPIEEVNRGYVKPSVQAGQKWRTLENENRTYYRNASLSSRLALFEFEPYSTVDQTYSLVFTKGLRDDTYGADSPYVLGYKTESVADMAKYADLDGDGNWWAPSSYSRYVLPKSNVSELSQARASFYTPVSLTDPFGNTTSVEMDQYWILTQMTEDAVGNIVSAKNDYRTMQASEVTDPNLNRTQVAFDALGQVVGVAKMGTTTEEVGDSLDNFQLLFAEEVIQAFVQRPTPEVAKALLANATSRSLHVRKRLPLTAALTLPTFTVELQRVQHASDAARLGDSSNHAAVSVTYRDGQGSPLQTFGLVGWEETVEGWRCSDCSISDTGGSVVKSWQPFRSTTPQYVFLAAISTPATVSINDVLGRNLATLYPDQRWTKTVYNAWSQDVWNTGNTVQMHDPRVDLDVGNYFAKLDAAHFSKAWYECMKIGDQSQQQAAIRSERYAGNFTTTHFDNCARSIKVIERDGTEKRYSAIRYDVFGNKMVELDGLGRVVARYRYNMARDITRIENMDMGSKLFMSDSMGAELLMRNQQTGCSRRQLYDTRRRNVGIRVLDDSHTSEVVWTQTVYGEGAEDASTKNLRGQVFRIFDQSGVRTNLQFDFKGNRISTTTQFATDYRQSLDWSNTTDVKLDDTVYTSEQAYNAQDAPLLSRNSSGKIIRYQYDLLGGLVSMVSCQSSTSDQPLDTVAAKIPDTSWSTHISGVVYSPDGRPIRIDYGNTSHTEYIYDPNTRVVCNERTRRDDGKILEDITYTYDCMSRVVITTDAAHADVYFRNQKTTPGKDYWYDGFGRLIKATGREMVDTANGSSRSLGSVNNSGQLDSNTLPANGSQLVQYTESYTYDTVNNILQLRHEFSDAAIPSKTRKYYYNEPSQIDGSPVMGNRLSRTEIGGVAEQYVYDGGIGKSGCMTKMSGYSKLGWDCLLQLRSSAKQAVQNGIPETTWYVYDSDGRRMRKVTDRQMTDGDNNPIKLKETVYLPLMEVYRTYNGAGQNNIVKKEIFTSLISDVLSGSSNPLVMIENESGSDTLVRYCLSQSLEVDDQARIVSYEEYTPFGNSTLLLCGQGIEAPSRYRFASYERDTETGLYLSGARYYCPWIGRWLSADPIGTAAGLNLYAYVDNNPITLHDPLGTMPTNVNNQETPQQMETRIRAEVQQQYQQQLAAKDAEIRGLRDQHGTQQMEITATRTGNQKLVEKLQEVEKEHKEEKEKLQAGIGQLKEDLNEIKTEHIPKTWGAAFSRYITTNSTIYTGVAIAAGSYALAQYPVVYENPVTEYLGVAAAVIPPVVTELVIKPIWDKVFEDRVQRVWEAGKPSVAAVAAVASKAQSFVGRLGSMVRRLATGSNLLPTTNSANQASSHHVTINIGPSTSSNNSNNSPPSQRSKTK